MNSTPDQKTAEQAQMLANRLAKKFKHLSKWAHRSGAGAFRLYDRDIPEIPLVLDYYPDSGSQAAVSGALYKRPYEKDPREELLWLDAMRQAAAAALGVDSGRIFLKERQRQRGAAQYEKQPGMALTRMSGSNTAGQARHSLIITENGLRFKVNLSDYLDTGLFLDRRLLRAMIGREAADRRVLNLFCYTGSYSIAAAAGGAAATCSVDLSNTYLGWAQENLSLNKIKSRIAGMRDYWAMHTHKANILVRADAEAFVEKARRERCAWDIIIADPPAFSNSKKMTGTLDIRRDYLKLLEQCLALLAQGGELWFSANARGFTRSAADMETELRRAFSAVQVSEITKRITDEDFRDRKIPRTFVIKGV
jgi:23S rRNA G2069 N7-methylase RlmK/C1962 C5-methylase RlmI